MTTWAKVGRAVARKRLSLQVNQSTFWEPIGVSQRGGCRYENGRRIPETIRILLSIAYGSKQERARALKQLSVWRQRRRTPTPVDSRRAPRRGSPTVLMPEGRKDSRRDTPTRRQWTKADLHSLERLARAGLPAMEIAQYLNRTVSAVYTRVQIEGVTLGKKGRRASSTPERRRR
jgi:hypothetical protein